MAFWTAWVMRAESWPEFRIKTASSLDCLGDEGRELARVQDKNGFF
jgi:hypothetical protein